MKCLVFSFLMTLLMVVYGCGPDQPKPIADTVPTVAEDRNAELTEQSGEVDCIHGHAAKGDHFELLPTEGYAQGFQTTIDWRGSFPRKFRKRLEKAVEIISKVVVLPEFYEAIASHDNFSCLAGEPRDQTQTRTPDEVADYIRGGAITMKLKMYRPWWPFSRAKARAIGNTVSFNRYRTRRSVEDLTNTLFHEMLHVAGFGHCGINFANNEKNKRSVPRQVGGLVVDVATANGFFDASAR